MNFIKATFEFVQTYGMEIIILLLFIFGIYFKVKNFISENLVEWLVDKVGDAESFFGSNTGQLKLRSVYNTFVASRPILAFFISFEQFEKYVDKALEKFEEMLSKNEDIKIWYETQNQNINISRRKLK